MSISKRGNIWWICINHRGRRIQKTTGTRNKVDAQQFHDQLKAELWKREHLQEKPRRTWKEAVVRWGKEMSHKRSLHKDIQQMCWLDKYLGQLCLVDMTKDVIDDIAKKKLAEGVKPATVNRLMALVRAVLRKAVYEWEWLDKIPKVTMRKVDNKRIRWLTKDEVARLLAVLPPHLSAMATFALATGLRRANVTGLKWRDVDLQRRHAWIHADEAKGKKAIPIPLNDDAIEVLKSQMGKHSEYVFTYQGKRIVQTATKAWRAALKKVGIENFRWHDLRHTWASWHVQSGTSLQELQMLGGWSSFEMVLRYAHLSSEHLRHAAERINLVKSTGSQLQVVSKIKTDNEGVVSCYDNQEKITTGNLTATAAL